MPDRPLFDEQPVPISPFAGAPGSETLPEQQPFSLDRFDAPQQEDDGSLLEDLALMVPRAAVSIANDVYDLADWALGDDLLPDWDSSSFTTASTGFGRFATGVTQFVGGFLISGGALNAVGLTSKLAKLGKAGSFLNATTKGIATDVFFFDQEENLSQIAHEAGFGGAVTEFLATDEEDDVGERRFKNALEGAGLGSLVDMTFAAFKGFRKARNAPDRGSRDAAMKQTEKDVAEAYEAAVDPETTRVEIEDSAFKNVLDEVGIRELAAEADDALRVADDLRVNPRNLSAVERANLKLDQSDLNLHAYTGENGAIAVTRAYERLFREAVGKDGVKSFAKMAEEAQVAVSDMLGLTGREEATWTVRMASSARKDKDALEAITARVIAYRRLGQDLTSDLSAKLSAAGDFSALDENALMELVERAEQVGDYIREMRGVVSAQGRGLVSNKMKVGPAGKPLALDELDDVTRTDSITRTPRETAQEIRDRGGAEALIDKLNETRAIVNSTGVDGLGAAVRPWKRGGALSFTTDYFVQSVLWGPKTHVVNFIGNTMTNLYLPLETIVGGALKGAVGRRAGLKAAQDGISQLGDMVSTFAELAMIGNKSRRQEGREIWSHVMKAMKGGKSVLTGSAGKLDYTQGGVSASGANSLLLGIPGALSNFIPEAVNRSVSRSVDFAGEVFRTPGKLLQAGDELFKQVAGRTQVRMRATRQGLSMGLKGEALRRHVAEVQQQVIVDGQLFSKSHIYDEALQSARANLPGGLSGDPNAVSDYIQAYMRENSEENGKRLALADDARSRASEGTFTTEATDNSLGARTIRTGLHVTHTFPALRLFFPFIRTPVNIARFASQRIGWDQAEGVLRLARDRMTGTPLSQTRAGSNRLALDLASEDPIRQANAVGRMAFGAGFVSLIGSLAMNVYNKDASVSIVGRGPADPKERILWREHYQPYSLRIKNADGEFESISFERLDPFATILGTIADAVTYAHFADDPSSNEVETLGLAVWSAVTNNFANKTYMQGFNDFVALLQEGDLNAARAKSWLRRMAGTLVPNISGQAVGVVDDSMREVRTYTDGLLSRIPWGSQTLPESRNVLGEVRKRSRAWGTDALGRWVNMAIPLNFSETNNDVVLRELMESGHPFGRPGAKTSIGGVKVDLLEFTNSSGNTAYDRWQELTGTMRAPSGRFKGLTLRQALKKLITSDEYKRIPSFSDNEAIPSPKAQSLGALISGWRAMAKGEILKKGGEFPELHKFVAGNRSTVQDAFQNLEEGLNER